jgi:Transcriptional regulator
MNQPQTLKERQRIERENLILQEAENAFLEKGFYETSMDEIAARVGIAKGTVYLHFPCKEDLVVALFTRSMQQSLGRIAEISQTQQDAESKLKAIIHFIYTGIYSKQAQLMNSIINGGNLKRLFSEKGKPVHELMHAIMIHISNLLDEGKKNGEFDTSLPTESMLLALINMFSFKAMNKLITDDAIKNEEMIAYLEHIYFNGIKAPTPQS